VRQLTPDYLESLPKDPFGGGPIIYSPEKRMLRSIGSDFEDKGGTAPKPGRHLSMSESEPSLWIPTAGE